MTNRRPSTSCRRSILFGTVASIVSATVALTPREARAGNTWDGGSALNGNWNTAANWDGDTLPNFSTAITFAGNANLISTNDLNAISVGGITFDAAAGAFTLRGNAINLTGPIVNNSFANQTINLDMTVDATATIDVTGSSLTIGPGGTNTGVISGNGGITKTGLGSLTLGSANTYFGTTTLDGGTVAYTADNTVNALHFGTVPTASSASSNTTILDLTNASLIASSLAVQSSTPSPNTITIGTGKTLSVNGAVTVGVSEVFTNATAGVRTALTVAGASWEVNSGSGHFTVGVPRLNSAPGGDPAATVDLTGLANFTYNATSGELRVGGGNVAGTLMLANTSNTIVAAQVRIGDSNLQPPGNNGNNNGGASTVLLGIGANTISANTIVIGATKTQGIVRFADAVSGTLTITGQAGPGSTANITIGNATSATAVSVASQLNLDGHNVNIEAGTVIVGRLGGSTGGTGFGSLNFDAGTFTATNMQLAVNASGSAPNGAVGTLTLGGPFPTDTSTAVLNVTSQFLLANRTNGTLSPATGTFVINGGTANINADIQDASTTGDPTNRTTTLTLASGTLDMMGHAIGSNIAPITVVNLPTTGFTAKLKNLGGGGINGAGLMVNGGGTLILDGTNTYTGTTTIQAGNILKVGTGTDSGTLGTGDVVNDGTLIFDRTGSVTVAGALSGTGAIIVNSAELAINPTTVGTVAGPISGTGSIRKGGNGTLVLSGANTYTGPTNIDQGTLAITGSITSAVSVKSGGALAGNGDGTATGKVGNVTMAAGSSLRPGPTGAPGETGKLTLAGLVVNGGEFQLDLGVTSDLINVLGTANFAAAWSINPIGAAPSGTYTILTANTLTLGVPPTVVTPPNSRQVYTPDFSTANTIKLVVTGNSKSLTWTGQANATWQVGAAGPLNWNDGIAADRFLNLDTVTFGDGPSNRNVSITGNVAPTAVTVNNSAGNDYTFSGGAIDGGTTLTKSGSGKLTLANANTHTGGITLNAGTLNVNHPSALGSGLLVIAGGSLDNTSGAAVTVATGTPQSWNGNFSFLGTNNLDLGTGGVTLTASPVVTVDANTLTVGGAISGAFGLTKAGAGALNLSGANALTGGVTLNAGTLNINNAAALGTGAFTIAGGAIDNTSGGPIVVTGNVPMTWNGDVTFTGTNTLNLGTGPVTLSADRTVTVANDTLTVGGVIDNTFGITKTGNGTLILAGANTFTGPVNINAGRLTVTNAAVAGGTSSLGALSGGPVTVATGAALDLSGNPTAQALNFGAKQFIIAGTGIDGNGAITNSGVSQFNALQHVTLGADARVAGTARFDIRSVPTSALNASLDLANHTLTKEGTNQFSLVGVNVTDGDIVVNQGLFAIETVTSILDFGTGRTITFNAGTTLQFFGATNAVSAVTRPMVFNGDGIRVGNANNATSFVGSNMTLNGDLTFTALNNAPATSALALTGNLLETGGARSIFKTGVNRLILAGNSNYTGTTAIEGGVLQIGNGGTTGTLAPGNVNNSAVLAFNRSDNITVPNTISGPGELTQLGSGTVTLTGINDYTGPTSVNAGRLAVSGSLNGTSSVSVMSNASLGGKGTIATSFDGSVTVASGGKLSPGDSIGTLTLALGGGSLDLSATAGLAGYLEFELGSTVDRVLLNSGTLNIGSGGLDLDDFAFSIVEQVPAGTYVLFDTSNGILGSLGTNVHATVLGLDMTLQLANGASGRDDLLLVVVPEPHSTLALLAGLGVLASPRRRRHA